jgi:hypothetical protein
MASLKAGKAGGHDEITPEHVKYGGHILAWFLTVLFNSIRKYEHIPENFRKGIAIPLFKGGNKDQLDKDSYRKITLLSVICKVFETLTMKRSDEWFLEEDRLGKLQEAEQEKFSSIQTSLLVREIVEHNRERKSDVYIAFLDTRKAFDCVWIDGLFHKLYKMGLNGKLWRLLRSWYQDFRCAVKVNGDLSEWFQVHQGVFQGSKWSMRMFQAFHRDFLQLLCKSGSGCTVYSIPAACPAYADDVTILALFLVALQNLLDVANEYRAKWRLDFGIKKCAIVVCGSEKAKQDNKAFLQGEQIPVVTEYNHVGVPFIASGNHDNFIQARTSKARRNFNALLGIGSSLGGVNPSVGSKLYWSIVIPAMLYGTEIMCLPESITDKLETQHRQFGKRVQGLPESTSNPASYATLGWWSIQAYIDKKKLLLLHNILSIKPDSIYRKVPTARLTEVIFGDKD